MRLALLLVGLLFLGFPAMAASTRPYKQAWAATHGGTCDVRLNDGSRVDVLTPTNAVDFVFAPRWQDAIGQSLSHAMSSGKRAGIVLIVLKDPDFRHLGSLRLMIDLFGLPIDTWTVGIPNPGKPPAKPHPR